MEFLRSIGKNTRLVWVLILTVACLYIVSPTARYFLTVANLGPEPTDAQRASLNDMLEEGGVVTLGLDLQGGVDFLLKVESDKLLRAEMQRTIDRIRRALAEDEVDARVELARDANRINFRLADATGRNFATDAINEFGTTYDVTGLENIAEGEVVLTPTAEFTAAVVSDAFEGALTVVRNRVDALGLTNPIVVRQGQDRIRVQIPGQTDPNRVRETLLRAAVLEFRLLHPEHDSAIIPFLEGGQFYEGAGSGIVRSDLLVTETDPETGATTQKLADIIPGLPAGYELRLGVFRKIDPKTGTVAEEVKTLAYLVSDTVDLTGENLNRASWTIDPSSLSDPIAVNLEFDGVGARVFKDVTTANVDRRFAIILDDMVYSAPNIREPIPNGFCRITGGFTQTEANDLSLVLRAGALKAPLNVVSQAAIGPSLGRESIRDSVKAGVYGFIFLTVFLLYVYRQSGAMAIAAMGLNILAIVMFLALTNATLTLAGIGGLLLTMGMAIDANVLIYERLREELEVKPPRAAITAAFARAYGVIIDSNITSLLPAVVLISFDVVQGGIKGFWLTLAIGLIVNIYTGVVVTRALVEHYYDRTKTVKVGELRFLNNVNVPWMGPKLRYSGAVVSGALTIASVGYILIAGLNMGVDFTGGIVAQAAIPGKTVEEVRSVLSKEFEDTRVVRIVNSEDFLITLSQGGEDNSADALKAHFEGTISGAYGTEAVVKSVQSIDAGIGAEFFQSALWMIAITVVIIVLYLALRFQLIFGVAAAVALIHDVFLSLGVFTLMGKAVTMDIVSALLVILGYSVNDTIVVFDRVREEMQEHPTMGLRELFERGINRTLGRTLFTGVTTLMTLGALLVFGGAALSDFALVLILGIVFGTYSSIFIASLVAYLWMEKKHKQTGTPAVTAVKTTRSQVSMVGATGE
ncbi:MAG: protein translocase subunit SecD [Candidatus Sumerlaeia bacterium]|nr:protein translocase subunit SecD [Candidatus Sumerlaeia bacterium]